MASVAAPRSQNAISESADASTESINFDEFTTPPVWEAAGPISINGGVVEGITNRPVSGALQAIAMHPADPDTLLVGAVNGGIWRTTNARDASVSWTPTSDFEASLSISSIAYSPVAPHNVVFAGIGAFSSFGHIAGPAFGLLRSTTGGTANSWDHLASGVWRETSVSKVLPLTHLNRNTLLVATTDPKGGSTAEGDEDLGLYVTTNALAARPDFVRVSADKGDANPPANLLPFGAVTDVVVDPIDLLPVPDTDPGTTTVYAAVRQKGVYMATMTAGSISGGAVFSDWTHLSDGMITGAFPEDNVGRTLLAAHNSAESGNEVVLYAAVARHSPPEADAPPPAALHNIFRVELSGDGPFAWNELDAPTTTEPGSPPKVVGIHGGGQAERHFSFLAHPTDANTIYIGGDAQPKVSGFRNDTGCRAFSGRLFVGTGADVSNANWTPITCKFANSTSPHADSRGMIFDDNGTTDVSDDTVIQIDDGGIYRLNNPATKFSETSEGATETRNTHWVSYRHGP